MKQIKFLIVLAIATFLSSCEDTFLSPEIITGVSSDTYFNTEEEIEAGVVNMYDGIQGVNALKLTNSNLNHGVQIEFYVTEMRSDNTQTKSQEGESAQFETFNIEATNGIVDDYYRSYYNVIYRANLILNSLEAAGGSAAEYEGEAKFVRAYAYFNLVRLFGDIPLVDKIIAPADKETAFTRVAISQIYSLIESDLLTAIANLKDTNKDRASKAAAEGILAKVYLTLGRHGEAKTLLESIMNPARGFSLQPDFKDVFYNEGNNEVIYSIGFLAGSNNDSQNFSAEMLNAVGRTSGVNYVTDNAKAAIDALGGDRAPLSYREDSGQAGKYQVVKYLPDGDASLGIPVTSSDPTSAGNDWIVLRYADVLLMHAEATMAGGASTSDAMSIAAFQEVRNRAGLTTAVTNISKQDLMDERRVELAFENHRFFDLVRFGEAQQVLSDFSTANSLGFSGTDLLLPIPQREINLSNGLLSQNPGY